VRITNAAFLELNLLNPVPDRASNIDAWNKKTEPAIGCGIAEAQRVAVRCRQAARTAADAVMP
jgi:hypothetical protein